MRAARSRRSMRLNAVLMAASFLIAPLTSIYSPAAISAPEDGSKGLFLQEPLAVQYWLEVARNGKASRVNNKYAFKSGDQLRIHIKSSTNGYAYVVLRDKDSKQVLFPAEDSSSNSDNSVSREQWINLPKHGALQFDNEPGIEKVSVIFSKHPINPNSAAKSDKPKAKPKTDGPMVAEIAMADVGAQGYPKQIEDVEIVALNATGNKDLVPNRVYVAYNDMPGATKIAHLEQSDPPVKYTVADSKKPAPKAAAAHKDLKKPRLVANTSGNAGAVAHSTHRYHTPAHINADLPEAWKPSHDMGVVTIESTDPRGIIAAEISLKHEQ